MLERHFQIKMDEMKEETFMALEVLLLYIKLYKLILYVYTLILNYFSTYFRNGRLLLP